MNSPVHQDRAANYLSSDSICFRTINYPSIIILVRASDAHNCGYTCHYSQQDNEQCCKSKSRQCNDHSNIHSIYLLRSLSPCYCLFILQILPFRAQLQLQALLLPQVQKLLQQVLPQLPAQPLLQIQPPPQRQAQKPPQVQPSPQAQKSLPAPPQALQVSCRTRDRKPFPLRSSRRSRGTSPPI